MDPRDLLPPRAAEDILAARIRIVTDGKSIELPVPSIRDGRAWAEAHAPVIATIRRTAAWFDEPELALQALRMTVEAEPVPFIDFIHSFAPPRGRLRAWLGFRTVRRMQRTWTTLDLLAACLEAYRTVHPASRHHSTGDDGRSPDERVAAAYELAASQWGYGPTELEARMTDEQLVMLLDALVDRRRGSFQDAVEAHRLAAIFARGKRGARAYEAWLRKVKRNVSLKGEALENAVAAFAFSHPEYVVEGPRG